MTLIFSCFLEIKRISCLNCWRKGMEKSQQDGNFNIKMFGPDINTEINNIVGPINSDSKMSISPNQGMIQNIQQHKLSINTEKEKYLILISSQNNLGSKENGIIKINFKENWVQKDNSKKEKETGEKNKLIILRDITKPKMFEGIEDINCNNFISSFFKENEIKFDDINSISICQNQQNLLTNGKKSDMINMYKCLFSYVLIE